MTERVRLYGHVDGESSFVQVTRGMARAMATIGELAGLCPLDPGDSDAPVPPGYDAPLSLNCGNPMGLMTAHRMGQHQSHWLLLAPNSEALPHGLADSLREPSKILPKGMLTGGLLAPSAWAAGVLRRLFPERPVVIAPHGVSPDIHCSELKAHEMVQGAYRRGMFTVLHMTSSETERKGTRLLLRAWKQAKKIGALPKQAMLLVVMNPAHMSKIRWWCADFELTDQDVTPHPGLAFSQADVAALYRGMHAVCQPSRGEGFGLVPLEALACGVPIVATACTGHSEFLGNAPRGAVIVPHGPSAPMDDFPGSIAPEVKESSIIEGLATMYSNWEQMAAAAQQNAPAIRQEWSWENKNIPAIRRMLQEAQIHV